MNRQILSHATLILPGETVEGSVVIEDGKIAAIWRPASSISIRITWNANSTPGRTRTFRWSSPST
jgi:alpha-D-ribose 1-methylphosphonate 5-triphosphate diphosphatase PhnM